MLLVQRKVDRERGRERREEAGKREVGRGREKGGKEMGRE